MQSRSLHRGISLKEARIEVEKIIGRGSGFVAVEIPFTPRAKRVLELALEEARQLGHNYIGTEHLLLGLLREGEGVAARVLENLDADPSKIRSQVIRMVGESQEAVGAAPGAGMFFSAYEGMKPRLQALNGGKEHPIHHSIAASCGEIAACLVRVPTAVVTQNMQIGRYATFPEAVAGIAAGPGGLSTFFLGCALHARTPPERG